MKKPLMALMALGIGAMSLAATPDTAEAGKRHGWKGGHGKHFHHKRHWDHGYYYGYYEGRGCYFYKKKARHTGKRFWWKKYKACKHGFHGYF